MFYIIDIIYLFFALIPNISLKIGNMKYKNRKKLFLFLLIIPLLFFVSFRGTSVGPDTASYYRVYNLIANNSSISEAILNSRMESGFVIVNYLFSKIGFSYWGFQIAVSIFIYYSFGRLIYRYSPSVGVSCFLLISCNIFLGTMNVIRMWIAVAILTYSIPFILKNKLIPFVSLVVFAMMFHFSAIVFVVAYPVYKIKDKPRNIILLFIGALVILIFANPVFTYITSKLGMYSTYLNRFDAGGNLATSLKLLVDISLFGLMSWTRFAIKRDKVAIDDLKISLEKLVYMLMTIAVSIDIIGLSNNIMGRISYYFFIYILIALPFTFEKLKGQSKFIFKFLVLIMLTIEFCVILKLRPNWYMVDPYVFFL